MDRALIDQLSVALLRTRRASAQLADQMEVTMLELKALSSLQHNSEGGEANVYAHDLVLDLRASKAAVSQMLRGLERRGYIRRGFNPANRRTITLTLTEQGERVVLDTQSRFQDVMRDVIREFGEDDARALVSLIDRLTRIIDSRAGQEPETEAKP